MNAIFFGAKRAYHACLRLARPLLARVGLTPARFDMLTAVGRFAFGASQRDLRRMLGVSASTVSRMARSLEELGLLERRRSVGDRRQVVVTLTSDARSRLGRTTRSLIRSGAMQLAVDCALVGERSSDESSCLEQMDIAEWVLSRLRTAFGDVAKLHYAWHPDD